MSVPTVYLSTDASAPVLSGSAGALIALFDACLVNGYGAKSAAGWTKEFSGTNLAAYRMATGGVSNRMYLRVDDTGTTFARVRGFDAMTDINTGTEPFPTVAQVADPGLYVGKSDTANATARPWILIATGKQVFFYSYTHSTATLLNPAFGNIGEMYFGEYTYYGPSFVHNVCLVAATSSSIGNSARLFGNHPIAVSAATGWYACRGYANVAGAVNCSKFITSPFKNVNVVATDHGLSTPDPVTGRLYLSRYMIMHPASPWAIAGHLPGIWIPLSNSLAGNPLDTMSGAGALAGRTFMQLAIYGDIQSANVNLPGRISLATSDWD